MFVVEFRSTFVDDVKVVHPRLALHEQQGPWVVVNERQVGDHVIQIGVGQEGKGHDAAEKIAGLAGNQNRGIGFVVFALLEGLGEIVLE